VFFEEKANENMLGLKRDKKQRQESVQFAEIETVMGNK